MSDYGFVHADRVFTPNCTAGIAVPANADRNKAIEQAELAEWAERPDRMWAYFGSDHSKITTWLGTQIGTITSYRIYRHNFGGQFISLRMLGTNGANYYGRASYDWGNCVMLRKCK